MNEKEKENKLLTWEDLSNIYKERTSQSAKKRPMDIIYKWALRQEDIIEVENGLILKEL